MGLSLSLMDPGGTDSPIVTLRGTQRNSGVCLVAHMAQENFVIGQFAKNELFSLVKTFMAISQPILTPIKWNYNHDHIFT